MKIFMYSDLHISRTSSILPVSKDSLYTFRQQMIIDTGEYMANIINEERPDLIINLGDTFDQHTITSYDVDTASEFFKCFRNFNIPHLVLVGNHEMVNSNFNAIQLLSNITNITVISEPCTVDTKLLPIIDGINVTTTKIADFPKIAIIPYCNYKEILEFPEGDFLFSHNDIQGCSIRGNIVLPEGIEPETLKKYKLVFNGHIHKPSIMGNIVNVGSITTHSFSDDETTTPKCYIFDTETMDLKSYSPTICPLFRKFEIKSNLSELEGYVNGLDSNYKYILHVVAPFEIKEQVKSYLENNPKILNSRLNIRVDKEEKQEEEETINLQPNVDVKQSFKEFLETIEELKTPKEMYIEVLQNL